jgi:hypothetical protein
MKLLVPILIIMYRDSMGIWDGVQWSGHTVLFYSIGESDESAALKKLLAKGQTWLAQKM